jgi:superoxide dismutase, Fe-Mn family
MNKREFLKTGLFGVVGLITLPALARNKSGRSLMHREFKLPALPYSYSALEPFISRETLYKRHAKLHAAYTQKLNTDLRNQNISVGSAREILQNASNYNYSILENCGGFFNHKIYWPMLTPGNGGNPSEELTKAIDSSFGSFEGFKNKFGSAAQSAGSSGWTWLIYQNNRLKVTNTIHQDNPFMNTLPASEKGFPILCIDHWDHAGESKYQNRRSDYTDGFWKHVNWKTVNTRFNRAKSR